MAQHVQSPTGGENRLVQDLKHKRRLISVHFAECGVCDLAAVPRTFVERRKIESSLGVQSETHGPPKIGCANEIELPEDRFEILGDYGTREQLVEGFTHQMKCLGQVRLALEALVVVRPGFDGPVCFHLRRIPFTPTRIVENLRLGEDQRNCFIT